MDHPNSLLLTTNFNEEGIYNLLTSTDKEREGYSESLKYMKCIYDNILRLAVYGNKIVIPVMDGKASKFHDLIRLSNVRMFNHLRILPMVHV